MFPSIPLTVLTGFLGAGKTTLVNHLVRQPELTGCAVLINEFGEVGIDHHLVEKLDDNLVLMESGCLCCTVRGDLTRSLRELFMRSVRREIAPLSRVIVETTGMADPAPVIYTLIHDFFIAERFRLDGIVTAVDATHADRQLARQFEAVKQVAMADRLLLTKCDLAPPEQIVRTERLIGRLNPGALRVRVAGGRVKPADVLDCGLYNPSTKSADVGRWLAFEATAAADAHEGHGHDANRHGEIETFTLRFEQPVAWGDFSTALDMLQTTVGERLLRVKGIVNVAGEAQPRVIQCVNHERYPDAALPGWPDNDASTRLVFIVRGLPRSLIEHAFASFCGLAPISGDPAASGSAGSG
ncbi:MAG: GTP-binding protein [Sterolibacteriaceae bacterium]|nr:GTP-binding protein [Candidatus Methylophosphatis haderslevensis]